MNGGELDVRSHELDALVRQGMELRRDGSIDHAIDVFQRAAELDPCCGDAWYHLAEALHSRGQDDQAIDACQRYLVLNPEDGEVLYNLGRMYDQLGRQTEAVQAFAAAEHFLAPDDAESASKLGAARLYLGDHDGAIETLENVISISPSHPRAVEYLAKAYQSVGRDREAAELLRSPPGDDQEIPSGGEAGRESLEDTSTIEPDASGPASSSESQQPAEASQASAQGVHTPLSLTGLEDTDSSKASADAERGPEEQVDTVGTSFGPESQDGREQETEEGDQRQFETDATGPSYSPVDSPPSDVDDSFESEEGPESVRDESRRRSWIQDSVALLLGAVALCAIASVVLWLLGLLPLDRPGRAVQRPPIEPGRDGELSAAMQQLDQTNQQLTKSNEVLSKSNNELSASNLSLRGSNEKLAELSEELSKSNEELSASNDGLRQSNENLAASNENLSASNSELTKVNKEFSESIAKLRDSNEKLSELSGTLRQSNDKLGATNEKLEESNAKLSSEIEQLRQANAGFDASNKELQRSNTELSTATKELRETNKQLTVSNEELKESNAELGTSTNGLSETNEMLTASNKQLEESNIQLGNSMAELRQTNDKLTASNKGLEESNAALRDSMTELRETNDKLSATNKGIEESNAELSKMMTALGETNDTLSESNAELRRSNETLNQQLSESAEKVDELSAALLRSNDSLNASTNELSEVKQRLAESNEKLHDLSQKLGDPDSRLQNRISELEQEAKRRQLLSEITASVGDTARYRKQLARYIEAYHDDSRSADFQLVLSGQLGSIESMGAWNDLTSQLGRGIDSLGPTEATQLHAEATRLLQQFGDLPDAEGVQRALPVLSAIAARADLGQQVQRLVSLLQSSAIHAPRVYRYTNGDCYYFSETPRRAVDEQGRPVFSVPCFSRFSEIAVANDSVPPCVRRRLSAVKFDQVCHDRGRTRAVFEQAAALIRDEAQNDWETVFLDVLRSIESEFAWLEAEGRGESIMRLYVLREVLRTAALGSHHLSQAFAPVLEAIEQVELDADGKWLDPLHPISQRDRSACEKALENMATLWPTAIRKARKSADAADSSSWVWAGWMRRDHDGRWVPEPKIERPRWVSLVLVHQRDAKQPRRVIVWDALTESVPLEQADSLREGTLVFVRVPE